MPIPELRRDHVPEFTLQPGDARYPQQLARISEPPTLYVRGHLPQDMRAVACVGTRNPTHWGRVVTERIVRQLVAEGYSIVSGLAVGIDAVAHKIALEAGGHTVAVLPCSLDQLYPRCHRELVDKILASGGALVSPYPPGHRMNRGSFVRRNRLQSGLSLATVIMQCAPNSGTMHTARFAREQERLLCVTEPAGAYAEEAQSQGNKELLRTPGCLPLRSAADYPALLQKLRSIR